MYADKFIRNNVLALSILVSTVIVALPGGGISVEMCCL